MSVIKFSFAESWGIALRQHPQLPQEFKSPEVAFSLPLLSDIKDNFIYVSYFVYAILLGPDSAKLDRPYSKITISIEHEINILDISQPEEFIQIPGNFPLNIALRKDNSIPQLKRDFYAAYSPLLNLFPEKSADEKGRAFLSVFEKLSIPELLPFYKITAPEFWNWLEGNS